MEKTTVETSALIARVVSMFQTAMPAGRSGSLADIRQGYEAVLAQLPIPDGVSITAGTCGGVGGYWVRAAGVSDRRTGVMLHGGGNVMGSAKGYQAFAAEVSRATDSQLFVADFRLAPEHPFPAAIEDATNVLVAATEEFGSEAVFAIGDSAGGGLVVGSLWELHRSRASLPAAVVLVSALVDPTATNRSYQENASTDPICSQAGILHNGGLYLDGKGPEEAPAAFPMLSDLSWFPPSLLLVGGAEVLRDDSRNLADKLQREGAYTEFSEYADMIHVWPVFSSILPQGEQALEEMGTFVRAQVTKRSDRNRAVTQSAVVHEQ